MAALFTSALLAAVTHHFFYVYLNGHELDSFKFLSQVAVSRLTTAIIFLFKSCIVAAVGIAYMQAFWSRVRGTALRIKGLDAMFSILRNPFRFFNPDLLFRARTLFILAMVSWTLPIASIFVPGALTGMYNFHLSRLIVVTSQPRTSIQNVSAPVLGPLDSDVGFADVGTAGTFIGASEQIRRVAARVLTGGEIINWPSPCGSNCSYSVSFFGPAYNCENTTDLSSAPAPVIQPLVDGPLALFAWGSVDDYNAPGVFRTPLNLSSQGLWIRTGWVGPNITVHCTVHNATYVSNVTFANNLPAYTTVVILHNQIPSSVIGNYYDLTEPSNTTPASALWQSLNMFAIEDSVAWLLSGDAVISSVYGGYDFNKTLIGMSNLVQFNPFNVTPTANLPQQLEELLVNTTLSLNFFLQFPPIPQIINAKISSPVIYTSANASTISYVSQYSYSSTTLWVPYSTALLIGLLCCLVGTMMLLANGVDSDMSFSQLLVTTRNSTLDSLADGACLGGGAISDEMRQVKLRYGELYTGLQYQGEDELVRHAAFGLNDEIVSLSREKVYA